MSGGRKQRKKRKCRLPSINRSQIGQRLEKLRHKRQNLWDDDDSDSDSGDLSVFSDASDDSTLSLMMSDFSEEKVTSKKKRLRNRKKRKNSVQSLHHHHDSNDTKRATCLICSIISHLSSFNCCSEHLKILKDRVQNQQPSNFQWLPEQVMIVPVTSEIVQHYLDPEQIHRLRTPKTKNTSASQSKSNKSSISQNVRRTQLSKKITPKTPRKSLNLNNQPIASTIVIGPARNESKANLFNERNTGTRRTSSLSMSKKNDIQNETTTDTNEPIIIDDVPLDYTQKGNPTSNVTGNSESGEPNLVPTTSQSEATSDNQIEFSPATARRTDASTMAAALPKIILSRSRFHDGQPIFDPSTNDAANQYRPSISCQSPPSTTTSTKTNSSSSSGQPSSQQKHSSENIRENNIDTSATTNSAPIQNDENQIASIPIIIPSNENSNSDSIPVPNGNANGERVLNENQSLDPSIINERQLSRLSYRQNPDGSMLSVSRPILATNSQSSSISTLRRRSTDVTPVDNIKK